MDTLFTTRKASLFDIGAIIVIIALFIARFPSIHIPYFWDELGVYAPGSLHMKDSGTIGILPADLDPLYSRGHPLLFYFFTASFYKLFGDSIVSGHVFAIICGCITLLIFYFFSKRIFNPATALLATLLLALQPVFFTMAGVLFPEMLLTLFVLLSVWGIVQQRWWLYAIGGSLAILVKEPAVVLPLTALAVLFIDSLKQKDFLTKKRWGLFILACLPYFIFGLFLLIQKKQHGWYFFPYHVGFISFHMTSFYYGFKRMLGELFIDQGRWLLAIPLLICLAGFPFFWKEDLKIRRFGMVVVLFILITMLFSCVNFYLSRYLLFVYPLTILLFAHAVFTLSGYWRHKGYKYIAILVFIASATFLGFRSMDTGTFKDTYDMSYVRTVKCVQQCITWLEDQPWKNTKFRTNFPIFQGLDDKRNGYLTKSNKLPYTTDMEENTKHIVYFYLEGEQIPGNVSENRVIKKFDNVHSHIVVYETSQ